MFTRNMKASEILAIHLPCGCELGPLWNAVSLSHPSTSSRFSPSSSLGLGMPEGKHKLTLTVVFLITVKPFFLWITGKEPTPSFIFRIRKSVFDQIHHLLSENGLGLRELKVTEQNSHHMKLFLFIWTNTPKLWILHFSSHVFPNWVYPNWNKLPHFHTTLCLGLMTSTFKYKQHSHSVYRSQRNVKYVRNIKTSSLTPEKILCLK